MKCTHRETYVFVGPEPFSIIGEQCKATATEDGYCKYHHWKHRWNPLEEKTPSHRMDLANERAETVARIFSK